VHIYIYFLYQITVKEGIFEMGRQICRSSTSGRYRIHRRCWNLL
jgi:hypothetical protein